MHVNLYGENMAEEKPTRLGWKRTVVLAAAAGVAAFLGVLLAAELIHEARQTEYISPQTSQ